MLAGIFQILHTPFTDSGDIDWRSFEKQVDYCVKAGVHGLALPAMASEFFSLSDQERTAVVEFALKAIDKRIPVVVGVQAISLPIARGFAEHAAKHGADALMAMPPYLRKASKPDVEAYYRALAGYGLPVVIQNAPAPVGTPLSPGDLAALLKAEPEIRYVKEETAPILQRISQIRKAAGDACEGIFGGANGLYLIDELERGACGNMPAGGVVDVQVKIYDLYQAGDIAAAEALNFQVMPLLNYAAMYGVSFHKLVLWRRGVLASPYARDPQKTDLDKDDISAIERLWPRIEAHTLSDYPLR
ncbi:MAG: dihydrodipicolinate synthase family protein [Chloroflexi bacterium]|nr:dihydrodipicolinate synthase family protein [Chloroflexota bacterium]